MNIQEVKEKEQFRKVQNPHILRNQETLVGLFQKIFVNRYDRMAIQAADGRGYRSRKIRKKELKGATLNHLRGDETWGVYSYSPEALAKWLCIDIDYRLEDDNLGTQELQETWKVAKDIVGNLKTLGINKESVLIEYSGRKGYHVWIFLSEPSPVKLAQRFWHKFQSVFQWESDTISLELFPHTTMDPERNPIGYQVKLPCGLHRGSNRFSNFVDDDGREIMDVVGLLKNVEGWRIPGDLPPAPHELTNTEFVKATEENSGRQCNNKARPYLPPKPVLTPTIFQYLQNCRFARDFFKNPQKATYWAWTYNGLMACHVDPKGAEWFEYASFMDSDRFDGSHRDIINKAKTYGYKCPTCETVGCKHLEKCPFKHPLKAAHQRRENFRPIFVREETAPPMITLGEVRTELKESLRKTLDARAPGVFLVNPPLGIGKTTLMARLVEELNLRVLWFTPTHRLADEAENIFKSSTIKIYGLDRFVSECGFKCPHLEEINERLKRGLSSSKFCAEKRGLCEKRRTCRFLEQFREAQTTQIVRLMHDHWRLGLPKLESLLADRDCLVIDENFLKTYRQECTVWKSDLYLLLSALSGSPKGKEMIQHWIKPLQRLLTKPIGSSMQLEYIEMPGWLSRRVEEFFELYFKNRPEDKWTVNRLWSLAGAAEQEATIRVKPTKNPKRNVLVFNLQISLPMDKPIFVLDSTGRKTDYQLALGHEFDIHEINPAAGRRLPKHAHIIQVCSGGYSNATVLRKDKSLTPSGEKVLRFIEEKSKGIANMGIISTLQMEKHVQERFPHALIGHFNNLRGLDAFKDLDLLFVLGFQGVSPKDVIREACKIFDQSWDYRQIREDLKGRQWKRLPYSNNNISYEVQIRRPQNSYLESYYKMFVSGEIEQAVGRLRIYQDLGKPRTLYLICNHPMEIEVDEIISLTEEQLPESVNCLIHAAQQFLEEKGEFSRQDLHERTGVSLQSIPRVIHLLCYAVGAIPEAGSHNKKIYRRVEIVLGRKDQAKGTEKFSEKDRNKPCRHSQRSSLFPLQAIPLWE